MTGELPAPATGPTWDPGNTFDHVPDADDLTALRGQGPCLWDSIVLAFEAGSWEPKPSRLCDWCSFRTLPGKAANIAAAGGRNARGEVAFRTMTEQWLAAAPAARAEHLTKIYGQDTTRGDCPRRCRR